LGQKNSSISKKSKKKAETYDYASLLEYPDGWSWWGFVFYADPESPFSGWTESDRAKFVKETFGFEVRKFGAEIEAYEKFTDTPAKRHYRAWGKKMDERTEFLETVKYDVNTWEMIDKMAAATVKLYSDLERIKKIVDDAGDSGRVMGDRTESLSESGLID